MKTLENVKISAYIKQCVMDGEKKVYTVFTETEIGTAKKRNGRYLNEIKKWINIENIEKLLKNKRGHYEFTDECAELLEEVLCLWHLSKEKSEGGKTQKDIVKQILVYDQTDAFIDEKYLNALKFMNLGNEIVIKVVECFNRLLLDRGFSKDEVEELLRDVCIRNRYAERKAYQGVFGIFNEYIDSLKKISGERIDFKLLGTEKAIWTDFAVKKIKDTMDETIEVHREMLNVRQDEAMDEIAMAFYIEKKETIERYKAQEVKIIELCKNDDYIKTLLDTYEKELKERLDLDKIVPAVLIVEESRWSKEMVEEDKNTDDTGRLIKFILDISADGNKVLKKTGIRAKEKRWVELIERIQYIMEGHREEQLKNMSLDNLSHNEKLLEKAIKRVDERKKVLKELQEYAKRLERFRK